MFLAPLRALQSPNTAAVPFSVPLKIQSQRAAETLYEFWEQPIESRLLMVVSLAAIECKRILNRWNMSGIPWPGLVCSWRKSKMQNLCFLLSSGIPPYRCSGQQCFFVNAASSSFPRFICHFPGAFSLPLRWLVTPRWRKVRGGRFGALDDQELFNKFRRLGTFWFSVRLQSDFMSLKLRTSAALSKRLRPLRSQFWLHIMEGSSPQKRNGSARCALL